MQLGKLLSSVVQEIMRRLVLCSSLLDEPLCGSVCLLNTLVVHDSGPYATTPRLRQNQDVSWFGRILREVDEIASVPTFGRFAEGFTMGS